MKKRIASIGIGLAWLALVCFCAFLSPYRYEWDEALKQVDPDKTLVLKLLWAILGLLSVWIPAFKRRTGLYAANLKRTSRFSFAFYGLLLGCCLYHWIRLFLL